LDDSQEEIKFDLEQIRDGGEYFSTGRIEEDRMPENERIRLAIERSMIDHAVFNDDDILDSYDQEDTD